MNKKSFDIICEEQKSPAVSCDRLSVLPHFDLDSIVNACLEGKAGKKLGADVVKEIVAKTEECLVGEFQLLLKKEIEDLSYRFEEVLQNEEVRTSYMMCEAHRERQEKILALQTQLECKNLAGLMYVSCQERKKSKMEKLKIIEEYTKYIETLQVILKDSQEIILNLSRGYKTAARVDYEWKEKVKKIIKQFQCFVFNYMGGSPEMNQYFFNIPESLKIKTSLDDNPSEDPCETEETQGGEIKAIKSKEWWETMDDDARPFVVYGDLGHLEYGKRKEVSSKARAEKTAPAHWKNYIFNGIPMSQKCPNASKIKDMYLERIPLDKWECHAQTQNEDHRSSLDNRRTTLRQSIDYRANMGSILKLITATGGGQPTKTMLLGARDSMEITSTTKMREKRKQSIIDNQVRTTCTEDFEIDSEELKEDHLKLERTSKDDRRESIHNDSMQIIKAHKPDVDHKINYEKVCPVEECRRRQVDSFTRSLPSYMRANPFEIFDVTYVKYEPCSPEQLKVLRERIERKKCLMAEAPPLPKGDEWADVGVDVGTQTSDSIDPCFCNDMDSDECNANIVYRIEDLLPMKKVLDEIHKTCFFDPRIQFNRFRLLGHDSEVSITQEEAQKDFKTARIDELEEILKKHPSLCTLFQANTRY